MINASLGSWHQVLTRPSKMVAVFFQMGTSAASLMEQISSGLAQLIANSQAQHTR